MANVTGDGIWSGRGIAIPVAGAMFGGDDYKEKIGREKIPWWLSDFSGKPSMAADAGWSSITLSRIEKGHDYMHEPKRMFPDQDVQERIEDNNYISETAQDSNLMRQDILNLYFDEERIVESPGYSLISNSTLLEEQISDEIVSRLPEWAQEEIGDITSMSSSEVYDLLMSAGGELGRDLGAIILSSVPVFGSLAASTFVLTNMVEMTQGQRRGMRAIDSFLITGSEESYEEMGEIATLLYDDYVDWLQAMLLLVPIVGPTRGFFSFIRTGLSILKGGRATSFIGLGGGSALSLAVRSQIFANPIFKFVTKFVDADIGSAYRLDKATLLNTVVTTPAMLITMGDLMQAYEVQKESSEDPGSFTFSALDMGITSDELQSSQDRLSSDPLSQLMDFGGTAQDNMTQFLSNKIEEIKTEIFHEGKQMNSKKLLRQFIRESIYHEVEALNAPQPQGYVYRRPKSTDEESPPTTGDYSSQIVKYKADMGNVEYQQMPEDLKEEALRRIIRRKLAESKKKRS